MHFEGEFRVPGTPSEVIRRFEDVPRMASCMPGAVLEPQAEDGSWPGKMIVAFGPKKVAFKGKVTTSFDQDNCCGTLQGRGTADMRAARIGVKVSFTLRPDPDSAVPRTIVKVVSDAELGGVLADFARTGGVAVANVIMADFARRASDEFAKDVPAVPARTVTETDTDFAARAQEPNLATRSTAGLTLEAPLAVPADPRTSNMPSRAGDQGSGSGDMAGSERAVQSVSHRSPAARPDPVTSRVSEPAALSAHGLVWAVCKHQLVRLARWLGIKARET